MAQTDRQTDTQTHGHGDSMTNSAQWGRVGEKQAQSGHKDIYLVKRVYMTYTNAIPCPEFVIDRCNPGRLKHSICNIGSHLMKIFAPHKDTMSQKGKRHYTMLF